MTLPPMARRNRVTIKQAPDFVGIAHYKPLFQFYKQDCFMFEIYFMLEKVRPWALKSF